MENVVLVIHLILALSLIGTVLLQRSEGGGLGMGGGGGGATGGRPAPTAMSKVTWILAIAFICTSIALTLISASNSANSSVVDRVDTEATEETTVPDLGESLLPPSSDDAPLIPSAD
ncbi:preprotein translocase subunit SecG [Loktanella sp. D2R18]|uniref:preprotein translocase subunit SecG n=1 Tax=Rhodobacterales TaxID=204455 RepID=UPI000DE8587D|nr:MULTISPECIES: preprotein translocase subunit SecG [Rhodobacterales]MDO6591696.1 preprotein translocase subunit SecG [Yoonia sp. 1_MG-2023]RBW42522.1 preprotein translocase subunit SecG [Loktanella sp. D2R18]